MTYSEGERGFPVSGISVPILARIPCMLVVYPVTGHSRKVIFCSEEWRISFSVPATNHVFGVYVFGVVVLKVSGFGSFQCFIDCSLELSSGSQHIWLSA